MIVTQVLTDNSNRQITILSEEDMKKKKKSTKPAKPASQSAKSTSQSAKTTNRTVQPATTQGTQGNQGMASASSSLNLVPDDSLIGKPCPICGRGVIIKGKTAYGCSRWREGCGFRLGIRN